MLIRCIRSPGSSAAATRLSPMSTAEPGDPDRGTAAYDAALGAGRRHRSQGELDAAVADFSGAHVLRPEAARPLVERGAIRVLQHRFDYAMADYRRARELEPAYPGLRSYVAEVYLYTGRPREALELSRVAAADEPDDLMHRINIAHALLLLGETDEAVAHYRRLAADVHPGKGRTGAELVAADLALMAAAGVALPGVDRVREALAG
jgi:tetratricopeptide (TPR) repeat protein